MRAECLLEKDDDGVSVECSDGRGFRINADDSDDAMKSARYVLSNRGQRARINTTD